VISKPVRLQLSRRRGFNLRKHSLATNGRAAVNVARPSKWGNPFRVGVAGSRADCIDWYRALLSGYIAIVIKGTTPDRLIAHRKFVAANIAKLKGKNLACWCHGSPCHADILLEIANRDEAKAA